MNFLSKEYYEKFCSFIKNDKGYSTRGRKFYNSPSICWTVTFYFGEYLCEFHVDGYHVYFESGWNTNNYFRIETSLDDIHSHEDLVKWFEACIEDL